MSSWKIGGAAITAAALVAGAVALSHHARADETSAPAAAEAQHQTSPQSYDEQHQRLAQLLAVIFTDADYDALAVNLASIAEANAAEIGMDPDALGAHIEMATLHFAAVLRANPEGAADAFAHLLLDIQTHAPGGMPAH